MIGNLERWLWRVGTLTLLVAVLCVVFVSRYQYIFGLVAGSAETDRPEPCLPGRAVHVLDSPHIARSEAGAATYNSNPPTSGPHFPYTVSPGYYDSPVPPGLYVHAMEHGHVVIHYAPDAPPAVVEALTGIAREHIDEVVLTPNPDLDHEIALTAWGRIETLDAFDAQRIDDFIEALSGRYDHGWARPVAC